MKDDGQEQTKAIAEIKKEVQLSQWQRQMEERQIARLDVAQWCERQGISKATYYYRLRKVREHFQLANPTVTEPVGAREECRIVPIHTANQAAASRIEIKYRELSITFMGEASPDALKAIVEALPADKELLPTSSAAKGVELCNEIFLLERELEGKDVNGRIIQEPLTPQQRYTQRKERLKPLLDGLFAWLNSLSVSSGTRLAKAVQYCLNEKQYLYRCLEDGNVPVDNNRAENAIRPFVVGRKNWLFANAVIYSLAATATANSLNVEEHFIRLCRGQLLLPWRT